MGEYNLFKGLVGSATAQQIIRKNDQAWRSFFRLLKQKKDGKLPCHIRRVKPPGYWKDRKGERVLRILIRNDSYRVEGRTLRLPFKLTAIISGSPHWHGKQGSLEIRYDRQKRKWYAHQTVTTEPLLLPAGDKRAYVDVGMRHIICGLIEGERQAVAYSGSPLLSDWWYWNHRIAEHQSTLYTVNDKKTSKRLSRFYRTRRLRFRQAVNEIINDFAE